MPTIDSFSHVAAVAGVGAAATATGVGTTVAVANTAAGLTGNSAGDVAARNADEAVTGVANRAACPKCPCEPRSAQQEQTK